MIQEDAAKKIGISPSMLSRIENGTRSPKADVLGRMVQVYGLDQSEIISVYMTSGGVGALEPLEKELILALRTKNLKRVQEVIAKLLF